LCNDRRQKGTTPESLGRDIHEAVKRVRETGSKRRRDDGIFPVVSDHVDCKSGDEKVLLPPARKFDALVNTGDSLALQSHLLQGQALVEPGLR